MPSVRHETAADSGTRNTGLLAIAAAVLLTASVTGILYTRDALTQTPREKIPLTVETITYSLQDVYTRSVSYLGLVSTGRRANLAFEIPGRIAALPLRQGSQVDGGELVAQLDDEALRVRRQAIAAELELVRTELELANLKARRQKNLRATGAVSKEAYDETRLRALALESRVDAESARLAGIDVELDKSRILAPYPGVVADHYVHEGTVINPGIPVIRLIEMSGKEAHVGVTAARAGGLVTGETYRLTLRDRALVATLLTVRPDVDPATRLVTAVFSLPEDLNALDGEPITLELEEDIPLTGGWLPLSALLEGERGLWTVMRLEREGAQLVTRREAVEVLDVRGDEAFVRGTLVDGANVIASGVNRVPPGSSVQLSELP